MSRLLQSRSARQRALQNMRAGTRSRASEIWPFDVLLRMWPPDKVLMGMQVCGYLRCELAKVPSVVVGVDEPKRSGCPRASKASWSAENLARGLMRLSGHVQLQIPATMPGAYVRTYACSCTYPTNSLHVCSHSRITCMYTQSNTHYTQPSNRDATGGAAFDSRHKRLERTAAPSTSVDRAPGCG